MTAPDLFQPLVGWRVWLVVRDHGRLRLASVIYPTVWEPRREQVAVCRSSEPLPRVEGRTTRWRGAPHLSPHERCACGIYASKSVAHAASYFDGFGPSGEEPMFRVIGQVQLWGQVIEAERGFRASHAYPSRLYVPAVSLNGAVGANPLEVARDLADYGVPVEVVDAFTKRCVTEALAA